MAANSTPHLQIFDNSGNLVSFLTSPDAVFDGPFTAKVWNETEGQFSEQLCLTLEDCFSDEITSILGRNLAEIK